MVKTVSKFVTREWIKVNDLSGGQQKYKVQNFDPKIRFA